MILSTVARIASRVGAWAWITVLTIGTSIRWLGMDRDTNTVGTSVAYHGISAAIGDGPVDPDGGFRGEAAHVGEDDRGVVLLGETAGFLLQEIGERQVVAVPAAFCSASSGRGGPRNRLVSSSCAMSEIPGGSVPVKSGSPVIPYRRIRRCVSGAQRQVVLRCP